MPPPTRCDIQIDDDGSELTGDQPSSEGPKAGDDFRPAGGITTIFFFRMTSTLAHSTAARWSSISEDLLSELLSLAREWKGSASEPQKLKSKSTDPGGKKHTAKNIMKHSSPHI
jgi:hypothetical protein